MTTRRKTRGRIPRSLPMAALAVIIILVTLAVLKPVIIAAFIVAIPAAYFLGRKHGSSEPAVSGYQPKTSELVKARAEIESLRSQLADARESAQAAWDMTTGPAVEPEPWECPNCHCLFTGHGFWHEPCFAEPEPEPCPECGSRIEYSHCDGCSQAEPELTPADRQAADDALRKLRMRLLTDSRSGVKPLSNSQ